LFFRHGVEQLNTMQLVVASTSAVCQQTVLSESDCHAPALCHNG